MSAFSPRRARATRKEHGDLPDETRCYFIIRSIIDWQVRDAVETSEAAMLDAALKTADDARRQPLALIQHSPRRRRSNLELRAYLFKNLYANPAVRQPNERAGKMLQELFEFYLKHPRHLGESSRKRARVVGCHRAVCDYLSGMTDRYAISEHQPLFRRKERSGRLIKNAGIHALRRWRPPRGEALSIRRAFK